MQEWKEKRRTMRHYDRQAKVYDSQYIEEQNAKIEDALGSMEARLTGLVLDIGCGTGLLFQHLQKTNTLIVGLDTSSGLLHQAKKHTKSILNTVLIRADADNTPFPERIFDITFAITILQNMPDPTQTILEMKRVSKPKAVFVLTGLKKKFTQEGFLNLLKRCRLKIFTLGSGERLKGHIAVCTNLE
jgi:ubiquinone/menaquinone biosynthesis C-methylase UbiE